MDRIPSDVSVPEIRRILAATDPQRRRDDEAAFRRLSELAGRLGDNCRAEADRLTEAWRGPSGAAVLSRFRTMAIRFDRLVEVMDRAAVGCRELADTAGRLRTEATPLLQEHDDWRQNPLGLSDEDAIVMCAEVRRELRDCVRSADDTARSIAGGYFDDLGDVCRPGPALMSAPVTEPGDAGQRQQEAIPPPADVDGPPPMPIPGGAGAVAGHLGSGYAGRSMPNRSDPPPERFDDPEPDRPAAPTDPEPDVPVESADRARSGRPAEDAPPPLRPRSDDTSPPMTPAEISAALRHCVTTEEKHQLLLDQAYKRGQVDEHGNPLVGTASESHSAT